MAPLVETEVKNEYAIKSFKMNGSHRQSVLSMEDSFNLVHHGEADIVLATVDSPENVASWWDNRESLSMNSHKHHPNIRTSGMTLGKLQRVSEEQYPQFSRQYFDYAKFINRDFKKTKYYRFFQHELGLEPIHFSDQDEMLIGSQREYPISQHKYFGFAPHCDSIAFFRAAKSWPISEPRTQTAAFLLVNQSSNNAGFIMWDYTPSSRAELDEFQNVYKESNQRGIEFLSKFRSLTVHPKAGELCIFNCRKIHAVEKCESIRRTIGSFFIRDSGWKIFD